MSDVYWAGSWVGWSVDLMADCSVYMMVERKADRLAVKMAVR